MFRLPVELCIAVFSYLNFYQLLRVGAVCRQWQQIVLDSLWPGNIAMWTRVNSDEWEIRWPDLTDKEREIFECNPHTTRQVLQTLSRGSTKTLLVYYYTSIIPEHVIDVLTNFLSLQSLWLRTTSISSRSLISILQRLPQITVFHLYIDEFHDTPIGRLKRIQLNLHSLYIDFSRHSRRATLHSTLANIVEHSPHLHDLGVRGTGATEEWTTKLGNRITHLSINVDGNLPPIRAKRLKWLKLTVCCYRGHKPFEHRRCDLSYLTHLKLYGSSSSEVELSIMKAYNIGENLEFLSVNSEPNHEIFLTTPKLKRLRMIDIFSVPPDVCPMLQTVQTVQHSQPRGNKYQHERDARKIDLESRGIAVLQVIEALHACEYTRTMYDKFVCFACGENHTSV
jgi:hypothetical protein